MPDMALYEEIGRFFSERLHASVSSADADLFEAGILDSLAFVELVLYLEQEFGIRVEAGEMELENFRSVDKIAAFAASHIFLVKSGAA